MYPSFRSAFENLDLKGVCVKNNPLSVLIPLVFAPQDAQLLPPRLQRTRGLHKMYSICIVLYCCCCWCLPAFPSFLSASEFRIK